MSKTLLASSIGLAVLGFGFGCSSSSDNGGPADTGSPPVDSTVADTGAHDTGAKDTTTSDTAAETTTDSGSGDATDTGDASVGLVKMKRTDLTADVASDAGPSAPNIDPALLNPWGLAFNPASGFAWIADNHSGEATIYDLTGKAQSLVVTVPVPAGDAVAPPSSPTGEIYNATAADFGGESFIFASEDGTVSGWKTGTTATLHVDNNSAGAVYKGIAIATPTGGDTLLVTNFHAGTVEVYDKDYAPVAGTHFVESGTPAIPTTDADPTKDFGPFNVAQLDGEVFVAYASYSDSTKHDDSHAGGYVSVFDPSGTFKRRLVSLGPLQSPWALAKVPAGFGALSGTLLVGNFGDGMIHVFDPTSGAHLGQLADATGAPLSIDGLWALTFYTPTGSTTPQLYFTAAGLDELHGVFGRLELAP